MGTRRNQLKKERVKRVQQLESVQQQLESNAKRVQQLERVQQQLELNLELNLERVQQLEGVQQQLKLDLEREAAFRKKGDRDNGERFVWLGARVERVSQAAAAQEDSQNLVASVENAGLDADAAEIERFINKS